MKERISKEQLKEAKRLLTTTGEDMKSIADKLGCNYWALYMRLRRFKDEKVYIHIIDDSFVNPFMMIDVTWKDLKSWREYQYSLMKRFFKWEKTKEKVYDVDEAFEAGMSIEHFADMIRFLMKNEWKNK